VSEERQRLRKQNGALAHSRIEKVLRSLDSKSNTAMADMGQLREMVEMDRNIRSLETTFALLYSRVTTLEKQLENVKEQWAEKAL
jgi:predicted RNase H-like nuclease (RuvC/YqgF family)